MFREVRGLLQQWKLPIINALMPDITAMAFPSFSSMSCLQSQVISETLPVLL